MAGLNKVILIGNVGRDPEVKYLDKDTAVANFTLATSETYRNKNNELQTTTEWHNIVVWRGLATIAEKYVKKGNQIYIEGKIRTRSWDDNGTKKYITEIIASELIMLGKREHQNGGGDGQNDVVRDNTTKPINPDNKKDDEKNDAEEDFDFSSEGSDDLPF